jgi:hypothetical protein
MTLYKFKVEWYSDAQGVEVTDEGIVLAESFGDAARDINKAVGDNALSMSLEEIDYREMPLIWKSDFDEN